MVLLAILVAGCERAAEPVYTLRPDVQELAPEVRQSIAQELLKYCGTPQHPKLLGGGVDPLTLERGAAVFQQRCVGCHGETGDGNGPAAEYLYPRPRDYRRGIFKFTSTPYGSKPRREDLVRVVRHGARGTSMPEFKLLSDDDLQAVVDYVLALTHRGELEHALAMEADEEDSIDPEKTPELVDSILARWHDAQGKLVRPLTPETPYDQESIERGRQAFLTETAGCFKCHGPNGRGQPVDNPQGFKDAWDHPTRAADLTAGMFHGGGRPSDIYRRIYSGINGTPMPGFSAQLSGKPETFWDLVHYVEFVSNARRTEMLAANRPERQRRAAKADSAAESKAGESSAAENGEAAASEASASDKAQPAEAAAPADADSQPADDESRPAEPAAESP